MNLTHDYRTRTLAQERRIAALHFIQALLRFVWRPIGLVAYVFLAMLEPFVGVILCVLAFGSFAVAILFGFIFEVPFPHRWHVLGASLGFMFAYGAYLGIMALLQRSIT